MERYCEDCGEELFDDEEDFCINCREDRDDWDDEDYPIDGVGFADPGGRSALRAATPDNPRDRPCPNCERENVLTRIDEQHGYICDSCADRTEGGW